MSVPSSRLSYSSTYSTNPSRNSVSSQLYFHPDSTQSSLPSEPSSLPYVYRKKPSYALHGDIPEPENYYQYPQKSARIDCRSLSPTRSRLSGTNHADTYYLRKPANHFSTPARNWPNEYYNRNFYTARNREFISQPQSLPYRSQREISGDPRSLSHRGQVQHHYGSIVLRAPPTPPVRSALSDVNYDLPRSREVNLHSQRDPNYNKAVSWKGAVLIDYHD